MKMLLEFEKELALSFEKELAHYKHKNDFITKPQFAFYLMSSALKRKESTRKSIEQKNLVNEAIKHNKKNALVNNLRK